MEGKAENEKHPLLVVLDFLANDIGSTTTRGAKAELARRLDVSPQYAGRMVKRLHVPVKHCRRIEEITEMLVTKEQLRPDIYANPTE